MKDSRWQALCTAAMGLAAGWLLAGCTAAPVDPELDTRQQDLISGELAFGEVVSGDELPDVDVLEISDEMREFVAAELGDGGIQSVRFRRIFRGLTREGYFNSSYSADTTRTAADTFATKRGNCLSYTNMFVALSRLADLDARFQIVDVPATWDADADYLIRYTHINVIMKGFTFDTVYGEDFSVDFNDVLPDPDHPRREISDTVATSLYYANLSVDGLRAGEHRKSFVYLKKAIELDPDNQDLWINLGAFYAKQDLHEAALGAYQVALSYDGRSRGALSGLSRSYYLLGEHDKAAYYEEQVRRYRASNPYYHYAIAQAEFERERYEAALSAINEALELRYRSGRFHFLKGLTEHMLGDKAAAEQSFRRANRFGNYRDLKERYLPEIAQVQPVG